MTDDCPHDDWSSRNLSDTLVRFTCHDCGETTDVQRED